MFLLSPNSISRPWVNFEAGAAWLARKRIIPVCFGGLDRGNLPKPYSDFQALDLRTHYYELVRDVFDWLEEGRRLPPIPFPPWDPLVAALQAEWIDWSKIIDQNRYLIISGDKRFHRARSVEYVTQHPYSRQCTLVQYCGSKSRASSVGFARISEYSSVVRTCPSTLKMTSGAIHPPPSR